MRIYRRCCITLVLMIGFYSIEAQHRGEGYVGQKKLYLGVAYYPEVWNDLNIQDDIDRMRELNINVVRMGEFSWALFEPKEGKYDFQWLHSIIDQLHTNGIDVILGTPTATPPVWMAERYPEIFRTEENGQRLAHGARRNCSYSSKTYRAFCRKICGELAREFGKKNGVIAWQTDNEFTLKADYSDETRSLWHAWLEERYGSVDSLNRLWATNLWSQRYQKFQQIPMPRINIWHHPSLQLEWKRFTNYQVQEFQKIQVEAIRKHSKLPVTHNTMPGQELNYPELFNDLDFVATNNYHSFQKYTRVQSNYDRARSYGKGMHWLFETAPNHSGGGPKGRTWFIHQPEGALRAALWMNYALGGQGSLFWLWRQHPAGHEMPHGAILSAWGKPAANYKDIQLLGQEISEFSELLTTAPVEKAHAAVFYSHQNDAGLRIEESVNGISYYTDWTSRFYRPVSDAFIHRDVIHEKSDLAPYRLLFMPLMPMIEEDLKYKIKKWVENGGILVLGPMSGYRTEFWTANTDFALGDLETWMGMGVESRLPVDLYNREFDNPQYIAFNRLISTDPQPVELWSEALYTDRGNILATYQGGMHDGEPAIIENDVGKGKVVLLGTDPGTEVMKTLALVYAQEAGIAPLLAGEEGVLAVPRKGDKDLLVIINLRNETRKIDTGTLRLKDRLQGGQYLEGPITLKPYQVIIGEIQMPK